MCSPENNERLTQKDFQLALEHDFRYDKLESEVLTDFIYQKRYKNVLHTVRLYSCWWTENWFRPHKEFAHQESNQSHYHYYSRDLSRIESFCIYQAQMYVPRNVHDINDPASFWIHWYMQLQRKEQEYIDALDPEEAG